MFWGKLHSKSSFNAVFIFSSMLVLLSVLTEKDGIKSQSAVMQGGASAVFS